MTIRPYVLPFSLGIGLIALAFGFAAMIGGALGFWALLLAFTGFPVIVTGFERDRNPHGKWWRAPLIALAISAATLACAAIYILSKI